MADFFIHDTIIAKCTALKTAMTYEMQNENKKGGRDNAGAGLKRETEEYLKEKTVAVSKAYTSVTEEKNHIYVSCGGENSPLISHIVRQVKIEKSAAVEKNSPDDFIRIISAVRNAIR